MGNYGSVAIVSVWNDEQVLEIDSGDKHTALSMYSVPLNRIFKIS